MKSGTMGARIREAMRAGGLGNPQVAAALGVSAETVSRWRRDKNEPDAQSLDRLAGLLGVDRRWLVTGGAVPLHAAGASQSAGRATLTVPREKRWREDSLNYGAILALQRARQEIDALMDQAIRGAAVGWAAEGDSLTEAGTATPASRALAAARAVHPGQHPEPEADRQTGEAG